MARLLTKQGIIMEQIVFTKNAKAALYFLLIGSMLLLGGIGFQMIVGISTMKVENELFERFGYILMSRGSIYLIIAYSIVFFSGIWFIINSPYSFKKNKFFKIILLCFYIWLPIDIYTISLDVRFFIDFNPSLPLTDELKALFLQRQTTLGPIPLIQLLSYLFALWIAIFKLKPNI